MDSMVRPSVEMRSHADFTRPPADNPDSALRLHARRFLMKRIIALAAAVLALGMGLENRKDGRPVEW
jgi:hypothetical protein